MIDLIERIGPYVGIAAFVGLAILAFLIFQQAREVRRLREWAGRAPERADEAHEATIAVAEARGEKEPEREEVPEAPGRLGTVLAAARSRISAVYSEIDRRSPFDPRYFLVVLLAGVVALGVLTSGFGLFDDDSGSSPAAETEKKKDKEKKVEVSVLNATQDDTGPTPIAGVPGLADDIAKEVVKPGGFAIGEKTNASSGFPETVIMFEAGEEEAAQQLADAVAGQLGETEVQPITDDVADLSGGAPVVLVIGQDDAEVLG